MQKYYQVKGIIRVFYNKIRKGLKPSGVYPESFRLERIIIKSQNYPCVAGGLALKLKYRLIKKPFHLSVYDCVGRYRYII